MPPDLLALGIMHILSYVYNIDPKLKILTIMSDSTHKAKVTIDEIVLRNQ